MTRPRPRPCRSCPYRLFASGAEAAEHGKRDIAGPSPAACEVVGKITRVRAVRGVPVRLSGEEDPPAP